MKSLMNTIYRDSFTGDANKGITKIEYDLLGNPKKISFADRSYIDYVYSADGRRIKTRHFTAVPSSTPLSLGQASTLTSSQIQSVDSTDYIGDFVFENNAFKQYHFFGGYITSSGLPTNYKYYVKDHLGNNRILASYNGTVEQTTHYYPFGATHHLSTNQGAQKYKYNGKEFDAMHGLNWYNYGARQYDPAIAQFTTVDPLCEKYYHISPYAYCGGNPVSRVDPDGRDWYERDGQYKWFAYTNKYIIDTDKNKWVRYGRNFTDSNTGIYYSLFGQKYDKDDKNRHAVMIVDELVKERAAGKVSNYRYDFQGSYSIDRSFWGDNMHNFYYGVDNDELQGKNGHLMMFDNRKANTPSYVGVHKIKIGGYGFGIYGYGIEISGEGNRLNFYALYPVKIYNRIVQFYNKLVDEAINKI